MTIFYEKSFDNYNFVVNHFVSFGSGLSGLG
jgi:hypothetical protein